jgi:hypothetical protein
LEHEKEGQMQAREHLLVDMEEKARERIEQAESEAYRLKGFFYLNNNN